ncbi:hypothetical protein CHL78_005835 [Romboutsia weinsteinii]|uniref:Wadjet protein JetD C-terminal domain-containing protein n=1 Tax=Romboutsia weinsteinii TaxID=2020949 RepID=A0A371J6W9_9FIRM|nr:Wadjet anti-phage system protein JetD domain-containing protein [Romboutsia weinsteinii]RDY28417.1 hypothetical protein CHL78_005835 [Romboutsia weinsteinii]
MNYKKILENWNKEYGKVSIEWSKLQEILDIDDYPYFVSIVNELEHTNVLKKYSPKKNGRNPSLFMKYKLIVEENDYLDYIKEIDYDLAPELDKSYYKQKLSTYERDRQDILAISNYIKNKKHLLNTSISTNERSYEVFRREKRIKQKGINTIMKNLGLDEDFFNYYETCEPIAYYSVSKGSPQNVLIIENQDTFYSIRKYIKTVSKNVLGIEISTVIYGGGNGRLPSINEIEEYTEEYISNINNTFYYFGDIDYAGISIYESYRERNIDKIDWVPFKEGYEYILDKVVGDSRAIEDINSLPVTKDGQKDNRKGIFMDFFDNKYQQKIENILSERKYIPQEALNFNDLISYDKEFSNE